MLLGPFKEIIEICRFQGIGKNMQTTMFVGTYVGYYKDPFPHSLLTRSRGNEQVQGSTCDSSTGLSYWGLIGNMGL